MKKFVYIIALLLIAGCASQKDRFNLAPCGFDVQITLVKGTRVNFTIVPGDEYAGYFYMVVSSYEPSYEDAPTSFINAQLEWMRDRYKMLSSDADFSGSFADVYCYRGTREIRQTSLVSGTEHKLYVAQVNPVTMELIGEPYVTRFKTLDVEKRDLTFQADYTGDRITITPSDPDAPYILEYENSSLIEYKYFTPGYYFMNLVYMYEDYSFVETIIRKGAVDLAFSDDNEETTYTLMAAGYEGGEIVTDIYTQMFEYHKGSVAPLE